MIKLNRGLLPAYSVNTSPGHVVHLPNVDHAHNITVCDNPEWKRPRRLPRNSWLGYVSQSCRDGLEMDRGGAWELAHGDIRQ